MQLFCILLPENVSCSLSFLENRTEQMIMKSLRLDLIKSFATFPQKLIYIKVIISDLLSLLRNNRIKCSNKCGGVSQHPISHDMSFLEVPAFKFTCPCFVSDAYYMFYKAKQRITRIIKEWIRIQQVLFALGLYYICVLHCRQQWN